MDIKLRKLLPLFVVLTLTLAQRNSEGERRALRGGGPRTIGGSVVPQGAASLAFVFDITGSMYDDLVQVIEGAAKILRATLARRDKPLYNYVLVPFHDPEIGPITVTTDPGEFQQELRDLYVQGGGDCPEMSIGAIRNALQVSLPNSFIYVFTDARAKDYILTEQVLTLIQEKQSQVVFVMTGDCGNTSHEGFRAYEQVASTSSGQVFLLKKSQVNEVLKFVSEAVQSTKVNLMSTDHHVGGKTIVELPIDANLQEITISISGERPKITLYGPDDKEITRRQGLNTLLNIKRALIVNLKAPGAGIYRLVVESDSAHTLRITGLSDMDFVHGYSRYPTNDISETILRPVKGIPTHVVINATNLDVPGSIENFELIDLNGKTLIESKVEKIKDQNGLYNVTEFMPPNDYFYVKVIGMDQEGHQFWRMSPTAITPVLPRAPNVTMDEVTHGHYDKSANINCHVFSLVPYYIQWYKDGLKEGPERFFSEPGDVIMTVEKASIFAEGVYTCNATNTAGSSIAQTMLDVKDPPPTIVVQSNATASPGYDAIMTCIAYSSGEVNLTWFRQVNDLKINLQRNPRVQIFNNGSVAVRSITNNDEGKYVCRAMNEGGANEADVYLFVNKPPVVTVSPRRRSFVLGESVNFTCSYTGHPKPMLAWYRYGRRLLPGQRAAYSQDGLLQLMNLKRDDAGDYECRGRNPAGEDVQAAVLEYIEAPTVRAESALVMIAVGDSKALRCDVTGTPDPFISWYRNDKQITEGSSETVVRIFGREIFLIAVQEHDAGTYKCVAENEAGSASATITVETGSMPTGGVPFYSVAVKVGQTGTLRCDVTGDPKPTFTWTHRRGKSINDPRFTVLPDGSLRVTDVRRQDEGLFVCRAENELGYKEVTAQLAVTGIILPKISAVTSSIDIPLGQEVNITCTVVEGSPPPTLTWIKGIEMIRPSARVSINDYGTLRIRAVNRDDDGDYTCLASNAGGNATHSLRLNVQVPPSIVESGSEDITVIQGDPITFKCLARGDPRPILTWNKGNDRISVTDPHYIIGEDGSMSIFSVDPQDSGLYTCTAMNVAGLASKEVQLTVHIRPTIAEDPEDHRVINGKPIILPCRVSGLPEPVVRWYKDGLRIQRNNPRYTFLVDGSMEIITSNVTDIGLYECRASNLAGNATKILTVQVQSPPSISGTGEEGDRVVEGGKSVILECFVKGDPPPKIRWQRNRVDIDPHDPANVNFIPQDNGALYIHRATPEATATYTCIAENPAGISTKDINLIIHEKPKFPGSVPGNTSVIENKGARLPCPAQGTPPPIITWYKNGVMINSTRELTIMQDGTLAFDNAKANDAGTYTCIARNNAGETSHVVEFKVYVPPKLGESGNGSDPRLPHLAQSLIDNPVVLECKVDAIPPPKIFWYKQGRLVTNLTTGVRVSINGSALTIHRVTIEDVGRYTCIARNVAGETEKNFDVDVFIPPAIDDRGSSPDDNQFIKGRPAVLECRVSGRPVPKITWYKNGETLNITDPNYRVFSQGRRLEIVQVKDGSKGAYSCVAKSAAGEVVRNFTMAVHDPPVIKGSDRISRPTVIAGDNVTLRCPSSGSPPPRITWFLGPTPIVKNTTRMRLLEKNSTLMLLDVEVEDSARYTCKAKNPAGETEKWMDLSVIVPPEINIDPKDLNPRVVVGRSIILSCPATGTPPPEIVWFRNRQILNVRAYNNMEMLAGGRQLRIQNSKIDDSALYTCKAINKAGDREVDFELHVLVPPVIDTSLITSLEREVIVNRTIALQCPASGIPQPNVTWYHQGVAVNNNSRTQFSYDGKVLRVTKARTTDAGRYTCQAINAAGQADQRFRLNVLVPPYIDDSQLDRQPKVIVNQSITLSCAPSGIPPPEISWLRNGAPLEQSGRSHITVRLKGRQLHIRGAETRDNARYTCIAANKAGSADVDFDLDVLVPPYISSENIDLKPRVNKGATVLLNCPATGHPFPEITWWRDRQKLVSGERIRIQSQGRQIEILGSTVADTGLFKCLATNPAGQASLWFDLSVSVAPIIDDSNLVDNPQVIVNRTVILECPVTGVPPPKVRWLKDGQDLLPSTGVQILSNGRMVKIVRATIRDTARYTCIANNKAGELRRSFSLEVMLPPTFHDYEFNSIIEVIQNRSVFIECPATGLPQPSFTWKKDDEHIFLIKNMNLRLLNSGRQLHIPYAQLNATGRYTCIANNVAGDAKREFELRVLVPPRMNSSSLLEYAVEVTIGETAKINCPVTGTPTPKVQWFRDGQPLNFLQYPHMQAPADSTTLHIAGASTTDRGRYACRASNPAGQVDKYFTLEILVPPRINASDHMEEINIVKGRTILIRCPVTGSPLPTIRWAHEDRPLFTSDDNIRFLNNGRQLQISNVDGLYVGRYTCTATNPAGTTSKDFMVNVSIKPTISYGPSKVTAVNNTRVSLLCDAFGQPTPTVTWMKNGQPFLVDGDSARYRVRPSGTLEVDPVRLEDSGNYRCYANNTAGSMYRDIELEVQVPPRIMSNDMINVNVIENDPASLSCPAFGKPRPRIQWQKGITLLTAAKGYVILEKGDLLIQKAGLRDAGKYVCMAQNAAGTAFGEITLNVLVPPDIQIPRKSYTVFNGRTLTLPCRGRGVPKPTVTWRKDGEEIEAASYRYQVTRSGTLAIPVASEGDTGIFTCVVQNTAGTVSKDINVVVYVPPHIADSKRIFVTNVGEPVVMPCHGEGVPKPKISWWRRGIRIAPNHDNYKITNGTLLIQKVKQMDHGSWVCGADSKAGHDSEQFVVRVQVPPKFTVIPEDQEVNTNGRIELVCHAEGIPTPNIEWTKNGTRIAAQPSINGRSRLIIENVRKEDGGSYLCHAENPAGKNKAVAAVFVNVPPRVLIPYGAKAVTLAQKVILNCPVSGDPVPLIVWTKNGKTVELNDRVQQLANGSLVIYDSSSSDGGEYRCVATNDAGTSEGSATLSIRRPPDFVVEPKDTIIELGQTTMIDCALDGEPTPEIRWQKGREKLSSGGRLTIMANNSLRIAATQLDDAGTFICIGRNDLGSVLMQAELVVQVHGGFTQWSDWGPCPVTCGRGFQYRRRTCTNPEPKFGGRTCDGGKQESKPCQAPPCAVDGGWGAWLTWQECSTTCGVGERVRMRKCNNPPPSTDGKPCQGDPLAKMECNLQPCPVHGAWSDWEEWGLCSTTCGPGRQQKRRRCDSPRPLYGGRDCDGDELATRMCVDRECEVHGNWGSWASWTACSTSCGGGMRSRDRKCDHPVPSAGGRECHGVDKQSDFCNNDLCPVDGQWSTWGSWGQCTTTCGTGRRKRFRSCTSPTPRNGGKACRGTNQETDVCQNKQCPVSGQWDQWSEWTKCTRTCGGGTRQRTRACQPPQYGGDTCVGDTVQIAKCNEDSCKGHSPLTAVGNVIGNINDKEFGISRLQANVTRNGAVSTVNARIVDIPDNIGPHMRHLVSILSPIYWTTASQLNGAVNGYTLTKGMFRRESQVEFATGEVLRMSHIARGVDSQGNLNLDIVLSGYVPELPMEVSFEVLPYTEEYVQTGPGSIYAYSSRLFSLNQHRMPYAWNHTISYDQSYGSMPYIVQEMKVSDIDCKYIVGKETLQYQLTAFIDKGSVSNRCPEGFSLGKHGQFCMDENECRRQPCSHFCHNSPGSFSCSCPYGLILDTDGKTCKDIDECGSSGKAQCRSDQECVNTIGSYTCVSRCGEGFRRLTNGRGCEDINECREGNECEQQCLNRIGGYRCSCLRGYRLVDKTRCVDRDECLEGTHRCQKDQRCENTEGGYTCLESCPGGMEKSANGTCVDVDECTSGKHSCQGDQQCQNTVGSYHCRCPAGFISEGPGLGCIDYDECRGPNPCQHECRNTQGSYQCGCPPGYRVADDGRHCKDIDECKEMDIQCGPDKMCFNQRGSFECIDVSCPANYTKDVERGYCVLECSKSPTPCPKNSQGYADTLEYRVISVVNGVPAYHDLVRLIAFNQYGVHLPHTTFTILENDERNPFGIRIEDGKGVVYTLTELRDRQTYRVSVRAQTYEEQILRYRTTFVLLISVSAYPY